MDVLKKYKINFMSRIELGERLSEADSSDTRTDELLCTFLTYYSNIEGLNRNLEKIRQVSLGVEQPYKFGLHQFSIRVELNDVEVFEIPSQNFAPRAMVLPIQDFIDLLEQWILYLQKPNGSL